MILMDFLADKMKAFAGLMHDVFIKLKPIKSLRYYGQIHTTWLSLAAEYLTVENFTQLCASGKAL